MNESRKHSDETRSLPPSEEQSESLLLLVEQLTDRLSRGEPVDFQAELAHRPADADRLREVFSALQLLQVWHDSQASSNSPPTIPDPVAGLLGDFRILREIGRGGMGVVYEAEQISLGRRVALKVFPFAGICAPRQLQRFQHEARAAASLHHPHIVPVFAVGCERGLHFYAMQYIEGRSLAEVMAERRRTKESPTAQTSASTNPEHRAAQTVQPPFVLSFRQVAEWGAQAAEALDYAHSLGIVHRDIKPANLLLDVQQQLWVTDFGLAQIAAAEGLTMTGDILGTLRYMSPEQTVGERGLVDQRTDVYSLGATLYELLTGQPVFGSADRAELLRRILHDDPQPIQRLNPKVPAELATIVHKCLERESQDRYGTASRLADDLRRYLHDQPIHARPPTIIDRVRKWSRRNRGAVRFATAFAVLSAIALAAAAFLLDRERQRTLFEQQARATEERIAQSTKHALAVNHYVTQINRADRAIQHWDFAGARQMLAECVPLSGAPDLRDFEWGYLSHLLRDRAPHVARHQGMAYCVRLSPNGQLLATTGQDGIRLWDAKSFRPLQHLTAHGGDVNSAAFSADGRWLATSGDDFTVRLWNTDSWEQIALLQHDSYVVAAMFLPGRNRLVTAQRHRRNERHEAIGENHVRMWDTDTWQDLGVLYRHGDEIHALDVNADGSLFATGSTDGFACIWDVAEHRLRHRISHSLTTGNPNDGPHGVAFARRGDILATVTTEGVVRLWNTENQALEGTFLGGGYLLEFVAISPDDRLIVTGGNVPAISLWHGRFPAGTRDDRELLWRTPTSLWGAAFLDGRRMVTAGREGHIFLWDTHDLLQFHRLPLYHNRGVQIAFTGDSQSLIVAGNGVVCYSLSDFQPQHVLAPQDQAWSPVAISRDRTRVLASAPSGRFAEWSAADWSQTRSFSVDPSDIGTLQYAVDNRTVLLQGHNQRILGTLEGDWRTSSLSGIFGLAPDDVAIIASEADAVAIIKPEGRVQLWKESRLVWERDAKHFAVGAISDDGQKLALGRSDGTFALLDTNDPDSSLEFTADLPKAAVFSRDGRTLAVIGDHRQTHSLRLWNTVAGRQLLELKTGGVYIDQVAFSPNGRMLAAVVRPVSGEREILVWSTAAR